MTRREAIKSLFNQNRTEAMFGSESARENRILTKKRAEAKKVREAKRIQERS